MNGLAWKSFILGGDDWRRSAPGVSRPAAMRWGLRSAAVCLAWSLLLVSRTATAEEDYYWEVIGGCKTVAGTKSYLRRYPQGKYPEQAHECLMRWEAEEKAAWEQVEDCVDIDAVERFLEKYPESRYAAEVSECIANHDRRAEIERRLDGCRTHFEAGRIWEGVPGNARECYAGVLQGDPHNPDALRGFDDIATHYSGKAEEALDRGAPNAAERAIERVEKIWPESPKVEALDRKLEELRQEIATHARLEQERKALRAEAEALFEAGRYEEVIALVADARKRGVDDKRASTLGRQARQAVDTANAARNLEAKVNEVRARIQQRDTAGARTSLKEAQALGLDAETHGQLAAEVERVAQEKADAAERQAREAMVSRSRTLREGEDYEGARDAMRRALDRGLPQARYREEMRHIGRLEAARLLAACLDHKSGRRWEEALACVRRVMELDSDNTEAREEERQLDMLVAFTRAHHSPSLEGYFQFTRDYPWSPFVDVAAEALRELESSYWEEVKAVDALEGYRRYLKIYPAGRYASEAREAVWRRSDGGG